MSDLEVMKELLAIQRRLWRLYRKVSKQAMEKQRVKDAELEVRKNAAIAELRAIQDGEAARQAVIAEAQAKLVTQAAALLGRANSGEKVE